ncbi:HlyD family secretion protein [Aureliella helgolandensis]|uniref:Macrolide export protein MacA n=1 Tax=Aureliella helgolandensis TaxID=2527968 RepID=A0A518G880_9BACT|nr:HlyD family efflux transporter periplasmic adaptor subunit [Aureliella helgolandensis]QDV24792.1 Macrolide export protein MacA [Aureliella helgolandensis]
MLLTTIKRLLLLTVLVAVVLATWRLWLAQQPEPLPAGIAMGNGRIEAVQVDVATKFAGRIEELLVKEGDLVEPGELIARMDTLQLEATLAQAQAQLAEVEQSVDQAMANIAKSESDLTLTKKQAERSEKLKASNSIAEAEYETAINGLAVAQANLGAAKAALRTQEFAVKAAAAQVKQIETQLADASLYAPTRGRVLYRLAAKGEVLPAGGKIITLLDLTDIYMEVYLPADAAVRTAIGSQARVVFDVAPQYAARAKVSFVAPEAQFTPKQVETADERDKLMFRVKVQLPPERVEPYLERIKTGIRGVAYIQVDPLAEWPSFIGPPFPDQPPAFEPPAAVSP